MSNITDQEIEEIAIQESIKIVIDRNGNPDKTLVNTIISAINVYKAALQNKVSDVSADNVGVWVDVNNELPKEGGRYWCYLEEQTSLGLSHFQWNCSYHEIEKRFSDQHLKNGEKVTHWMLLPSPPESEPQQKEGEDEIYDSIYMEVVELVEKDNIQCEFYKETAEKLKVKYLITHK